MATRASAIRAETIRLASLLCFVAAFYLTCAGPHSRPSRSNATASCRTNP